MVVGAAGDVRVSIRAPVRGATDLLDAVDEAGWFQSAPPCGGRLLVGLDHRCAGAVSIRAPVRGATMRAWSTKRVT